MNNITFQQLEAFFTVAEHLNLSETAEMMFISQSALSKIITRLETGIGVKLFIRENRGVSLTREGQYLYKMLRQPLDSIAHVISTVQSMQEQQQNGLRIGCTTAYDFNTDYTPVKNAIAEYHADYPEIVINKFILEPDYLRQALMFATLDLVVSQSFLLNGLKEIATVKVHPLGTYLAVSSKHPMAQFDEIIPELLINETVYLISLGWMDELDIQTDSHARKICAALGFTPKEIKSVPNISSLIHALDSGGIGISGRIDIIPEDIKIRIYPVADRVEIPELYVNVSWSTKSESPQVRDFLQILRKHVLV